MRVVRQILVGLGLIVIGVGVIVAAQGIISLTGPTGEQSSAIIITVLGAIFLIGGVALLIWGIRKKPMGAPEVGAETVDAAIAGEGD